MSAIVWHNHRLYADSRIVKGDEVFHSLTKVQKLAKVLTLASKKHAELNDRIHGWYCVGTHVPAHHFVQQLIHADGPGRYNADLALLIYGTFEKLHLASYDNLFEVILIGEKANYGFRLEDNTFAYNVHDHKNCLGVGTGGRLAVDTIIDQRADPVRALYSTFYRDSLSGGMIDIWELTRGKKAELRRVGICNEIPTENIPTLLVNIRDPYPYDFVPPTTKRIGASKA